MLNHFKYIAKVVRWTEVLTTLYEKPHLTLSQRVAIYISLSYTGSDYD